MLARVANNLFWMGRYIERAEHLARYLNVNYFSSLDAPNEKSQSRDHVLHSLLFMANGPVDEEYELTEKNVFYDIGMSSEQPFSILNSIKYARENANGARDLISTELYESINKFYHFVLSYDSDYFVTKGLFDFTTQVAESTSIIRAKIRGTLLHDEVYAIIMLGVNIERATQVVRIIQAKYYDALNAQGGYDKKFSKSYEWTTLLKCIEAYDMMRRHYKKTPTSLSTLEFLILNPECPRSVMNSLVQVKNHISVLNEDKYPGKDTVAFLIGKTHAEYRYRTVDTIEGNVESFIEEIQDTLIEIAKKIEKEYFNY